MKENRYARPDVRVTLGSGIKNESAVLLKDFGVSLFER